MSLTECFYVKWHFTESHYAKYLKLRVITLRVFIQRHYYADCSELIFQRISDNHAVTIPLCLRVPCDILGYFIQRYGYAECH
jgi:hypothetical protein